MGNGHIVSEYFETDGLIGEKKVKDLSLRDYFAGQALAGLCSNFKDMTIRERISVTEISSDIARMMVEEKEHKILASLDEKNNV